MEFTKSLFVFLFLTAVSVSGFAQKTMPDVEVKTLDGKAVNIQDYTKEGKITVVSFWATWCSPCKKELNAIADVYEEWQDEYDMQLIAVTTDNSRSLRKVKPMVDGFSWDYIILSDVNQDLQKALNFQTVPYTMLIDAEGNVVYTHSGYSPGDENELEEKIAALAEANEEVEEEVEEVKKEKKSKKKKKK